MPALRWARRPVEVVTCTAPKTWRSPSPASETGTFRYLPLRSVKTGNRPVTTMNLARCFCAGDEFLIATVAASAVQILPDVYKQPARTCSHIPHARSDTLVTLKLGQVAASRYRPLSHVCICLCIILSLKPSTSNLAC
jgi:hypothetical protein